MVESCARKDSRLRSIEVKRVLGDELVRDGGAPTRLDFRSTRGGTSGLDAALASAATAGGGTPTAEGTASFSGSSVGHGATVISVEVDPPDSEADDVVEELDGVGEGASVSSAAMMSIVEIKFAL